jgi:GNAT superfamily N-acetyltransferase
MILLIEGETKGGVAPEYMEWEEYLETVNKGGKRLAAQRLTYSLEEMREIKKDKDHEKIVRKRIKDRFFSFYKKEYPTEHAEFDGKKFVPKYEEDYMSYLGILATEIDIICVDEKSGDTVGVAEQRTGNLYVGVAEEYQGIGIGQMLLRLFRNTYPFHPSGGLTEKGERNLKRFHSYRVKRALADGMYSRAIRQGVLSLEKMRKIVSSAEKA